MSLRSILGGSRIRKSSKKSGAKQSSSSSSSPLSSSPWAASLPRRKPGTQERKRSKIDVDNDDDDLFNDKLDDYGLVKALVTDMNLRDTSQAILYIRSHMFSSMPEQAAGMNSTRVAEVLNYRKRLPPIVTISHIQTLLSSPSAVEREVAELARAGFLRKVIVARRGDIGETVILATDLEKMIQESTFLDKETKDSLSTFLKENPGTQTVRQDALSPSEVNQLMQAGFITSHYNGAIHHGPTSHTTNLYSRPEDKVTLTSLDFVSRQPTGSLGAVGGTGAVHNVGGTGGGSLSRLGADPMELKLAVPGNGAFLKLLSAALEHLVSLLGKSRYREAPETVLRDRWDGGIAKDEARYAAKRSRGEFAGILPGQTRKWRQFYGLSFDWVLQEAVGSGMVEVFETRSVGRGVRAI